MMKRLILIVSISTLCNFAQADKWYDGVGDNIATGIGGIIGGTATGLVTKSPTYISAGAIAGGTAGQVLWNGIYNTINSPPAVKGGGGVFRGHGAEGSWEETGESGTSSSDDRTFGGAEGSW